MFRVALAMSIGLMLAPLEAQITTATILGTVTDASGAVVGKALVEAKALATNLMRATTTDGDGNFTLSNLPLGEYEVSISAAGFRKEIQRGIVLQVQQRARIDVALQPGNVTETVNVTASTPIVNTEDGVFGDVIDNKRVVELPLNGRNFNTLALLTPNVQNGVQGGATLQTFLAGGIGIWAHGSRDTDNEWNLDGATMSVGFYNWNSFNPSVDAIQEFKMQTGNYSAEFGFQAGANVNIFSDTGASIAFSRTDGSGVYSATGLPAGIYYAKTGNSQGYIDQLFANTVCPSCQNTSGTAIDLRGAGMSATADFSLTLGARVSGKVTDAGTGLPLASSNVSFHAANGTFMANGFTNDAGNYTTFSGLPAGTYFAQASVTGYVNQLYSAIQCNTSNCSVVSGTAIAVIAGTPKTGIDFAMALGGRVTGTITDSASTTTPPAAVEGVNVSIFDAVSGSFIRSGTSTASGTFSVVGLPAGTYTARTSNSVGFIDELFDDLKCATCSASSGKPFTVTVGATTSGINFGLGRGGRRSGFRSAPQHSRPPRRPPGPPSSLQG